MEEQDITIFNWLKNIYLKRGKTVGNGKRTQRLIASFRVKSGIELNKLSYLCKTFITDEEQQEYSHKLENVFYKPKTMFATKFVLEDSRLWQYYMKHKTMFDKEFEKLN